MKSQLKIVLFVFAAMLLTACNKKTKEVDTTSTDTTQTAPVDQGSAVSTDGTFTVADLDSNSCLMKRVIYFDYDQDMLKPEFQAIVACHSKYLRDRPSSQMSLEGNADERGTREYNLALGERRGNAVLSAFVANSAPSSRINVVSYGEERPLCLDSDDSCWAKNRRVEIVYTVK
jgi:peptidoglycan-associated lipoprotein